MLHIGGAENERIGQWVSTQPFCEEIGEKRSSNSIVDLAKDSVNHLGGAKGCQS
jgi:hypothetical protein